ncbi:putative nuclease HARBI1 isoform X2, partial [Tanacetum coccineum]
MVESIDCTKWPWAQCLVGLRGQLCRGDSRSDPFILLEAVASQDLWIWHAFFGVAGSNNDINIIQWSVLILSISHPDEHDTKRIRYKQAHEAARKDVERAFGVLKKKWAIIKTPAWSRSLRTITKLMYTCIILHNIIIKDRKKAISLKFFWEEQH